MDLKNDRAFIEGMITAVRRKVITLSPENDFEYARMFLHKLESLGYNISHKNQWRHIDSDPPDVGTEVLIVIDVRDWDPKRKVTVESAFVHYSEEPRPYGGPNCLTGAGFLTGIYFSIPSIPHPDSVKFWMPKPIPPNF